MVLLPAPFSYNPWKHHLSWLRFHLHQAIHNSGKLDLMNEFIENIKSINSNYVDIYTGQLSPENLIHAIDEELKKLMINNRKKFSSWLGKHEYRIITLTDQSVWVLREGLDDELYIHIHPARNAPNIARIHGNSWKTILIIKAIYPTLTEPDKIIINEVRKSYLQLSPIKTINSSPRLMKAIGLLQNASNNGNP
jgi:hypothetical protein